MKQLELSPVAAIIALVQKDRSLFADETHARSYFVECVWTSEKAVNFSRAPATHSMRARALAECVQCANRTRISSAY
jgi:hypothetical protein